MDMKDDNAMSDADSEFECDVDDDKLSCSSSTKTNIIFFSMKLIFFNKIT